MTNIDEILNDVKERLNINDCDIDYFTEGKTESIVFSINNEYLIKTCTKNELDIYNEFFSKYQSEYYQKIYYINYDLSYICLSFLEGNKYKDDLEIDYLINSLYDITSNYQIVDYDGYGYLFEDHKSWSDFLKDEVEYSNSILKSNDIDMTIINNALDKISNYKVDKYLLHGDLGVHNFIVNNSKLYIIDPMGLVGDPIYDFYYAVFSELSIFKSLSIDKLLEFFDRDLNYKKYMTIIVFYIRLCRTYKYDIKKYDDYLKYYNNTIKNMI